MLPKDPDSARTPESRNKSNRPRAIRRLVIWYRRNAAVTSLVDSATTSASAATSVAETVVTGAGSVASQVLQPLVFDPLRRLQGGDEPVGIVDFALLISAFSSTLANIDSKRAIARTHLEMVQDYLVYKRVPLEVKKRIGAFYEYLYSTAAGRAACARPP